MRVTVLASNSANQSGTCTQLSKLTDSPVQAVHYGPFLPKQTSWIKLVYGLCVYFITSIAGTLEEHYGWISVNLRELLLLMEQFPLLQECSKRWNFHRSCASQSATGPGELLSIPCAYAMVRVSLEMKHLLSKANLGSKVPLWHIAGLNPLQGERHFSCHSYTVRFISIVLSVFPSYFRAASLAHYKIKWVEVKTWWWPNVFA